MDINLIKREIFDRIEDGSDLTQAHRIWLYNIIEGVTTMMLIRSYISEYGDEKHVDMKELQINDVVQYVFNNHIKM